MFVFFLSCYVFPKTISTQKNMNLDRFEHKDVDLGTISTQNNMYMYVQVLYLWYFLKFLIGDQLLNN